MSIPVLRILLNQMDWANRRLLAQLSSVAAPPPDAVQLLTHIVLAERNWLSRIAGETPPTSVGVSLPLNEIEVLMNRHRRAFEAMLATDVESDLDRVIVFRSSQGVEYRMSVRDILLQLATHGFHHRGQIARILRQAGAPPVETSYISYVRETAAQPANA